MNDSQLHRATRMRLTPEGSKTYNTRVALFYLHKIQNQSKPNFHIWVMKQLRKVKKCISLKYSKQNNDPPPPSCPCPNFQNLWMCFLTWQRRLCRHDERCANFPFYKDTSHIGPETPNTLILTWSPLQRPCLQTRSHSEVLGVSTSPCKFCGTWSNL